MAIKINTDNYEEKITQHTGSVLLEFYSDSCVPCKRVSPLLAQMEEDYGDRLLVGKVNVPFARELTEQHNVLSTPTFLFLRDGQEKARVSGTIKKAEMIRLIEAIL